ncbi:MAG TPA: DUF1501 domain-containing protein [Nannocystis exedens]|nr:DUF1501 domain-containing protein [Nannocystis exedens]
MNSSNSRRGFLKLAALSGLALAAPFATRRATAELAPYNGPFFVLIHANGGWDPVYLCDPKANPALDRLTDGAATAGSISYAPVTVDAAALGLPAEAQSYLMSNQEFFEKYSSKLTVINGIDTSTNNHDGGTRVTWSGQLQEGHPSFGALAAAVRSPNNPLAYISSGGYDATQGIIPVTRMGNLNSLQKVAFPDIIYPEDADSERFLPAARMSRIREANAARLGAQLASQRLPRAQSSMNELLLARADDNALANLNFPDELVSIPGYDLNDLQNLMQQAQLALAAFQAGLAVSVNLNLSGFDTHGNHDRDQIRQLAKLLYGVDFLLSEADKLGLGEQITVMLSSDFARGPGYNGNDSYAGKDHWPITSAMLMGAGIQGDRVLGSTDDDQYALPHQGTILTPAHIHHSLRALAGISDHELAQDFPLAGEDLGLFA